MLFFNKLLPIFVLPLGLTVILLVVGLLRKKRWPVIAALALLYLSSLPVVGDHLMRALESQYAPLAPGEVEKADAIVPLGGIFLPSFVHDCPACLPNLGEGSDRLEAGIELWQHKRARYLVFTGGRVPWERQVEVEGVASKRVAEARGVPADRVLVTTEVGNTEDEARAVAAMMHERGWSKIILVTSAWHMPRAARQFRKAGIDFIPFPVDYQAKAGARLTMLDFLPHADALRKTEQSLRELYGIAFYAIRAR
jgi:uncharacterized SAM-binding protein YcdF (DUF218 family)